MIVQTSVEAKGKQLPTAAHLLQWYDRHARVLPWRLLGGGMPDPYRVWISEIMLQQTTVQAVKAYFLAFTNRWPTVHALADAPVEEVMKMWAGLGYYSRARNLHACARAVVEQHGGVFPSDETTLQSLPGIGVYTSAAISAIAYNKRAVVVDGNVERVIARLFQVEQALSAAKTVIRAHADALTPDQRPGDFAQAMMDLGATVCTPRKPGCAICPFLGACDAQRNSDPEIYPHKAAKSEKPLRRGAAFLVWREDGALLVRTRPPKGLLGGMTEVPGTVWLVGAPVWLNPQGAPFAADWQRSTRVVRHVFTHFPLELSVFRTTVDITTAAPADMRWLPGKEIGNDAFPTVFRKVLSAEFD